MKLNLTYLSMSVASLCLLVYFIPIVNAVDQLDRYWIVLDGDQKYHLSIQMQLVLLD